MKRIEITVAPDGSTQVETQGFVGSECRQASRFVEQALGVVQTEQLKREFYQSSTSEQQLPQQSG